VRTVPSLSLSALAGRNLRFCLHQERHPRCRTRGVAPSSPRERLLAGGGWKLENHWPPVPAGELTLVTALADYDGMCRPLEFNVFVFSNGDYAGTLSPVNMNSRSDGVLATPNGKTGVSISPDGVIRAEFTRYAPNDPLCCPSRGMTRVVYRMEQANGSPIVAPVQIGNATSGLLSRPARWLRSRRKCRRGCLARAVVAGRSSRGRCTPSPIVRSALSACWP